MDDNLDALLVLNEFSFIKHQMVSDFFENTKCYLDDLSLVDSAYIDNFENTTEELLHEFSIESIRLKNENIRTSFLFNPLRYFCIGETLHSYLLAKLLDPNAEHGQGKLFLKCFLEKFKIVVFEQDHWSVTAEQGRIDILIKRKYPHSVIVIENKSNYANDQENQIYRYWLQEMYIPNDDKPARYTLDKKDSYRILYLSPDSNKSPDSNSLEKPNWKWLDDKYPNLPNHLDIDDIEIIQFNKEILEWLENSFNLLDQDNHRLREYIRQYIELWSL